MDQASTYSRREALSMFGAAGLPALTGVTLGSAAIVDHYDLSTLFHQSKRRLADSLQAVRGAIGSNGRRKAFERFAEAFHVHEHFELRVDLARDDSAATVKRGLYRQSDPNDAITRGIIRELRSWPQSQTGWNRRFRDLERHLEKRFA